MPAARPDAQEIARQAWFALPIQERSAEAVRKKLKGVLEPVPAKGSINRWAAEWRKVVEKTADVLLPPPNGVVVQDLSSIPQALQEVLSPRLLHIGRGEGLDKVEDAIIKLADAIASKAPEIAQMLLDTESETEEVSKGDDGELTRKRVEKGKVARAAVSALGQLASAMQTVTASKTMLSLAHKNFGEGDYAMAQAQATLETGRAERARDITPGGNGPSSNNGLTAEQEAMATLRGTVTISPPRK